jgi:hypothetical protein
MAVAIPDRGSARGTSRFRRAEAPSGFSRRCVLAFG